MNQAVTEDRLHAWVELRNHLVHSEDALQEIADYWSTIKTIPFNNNVDPYNYKSWPTPWELIEDNVYDDLTLAIVIGYTVKLTERFKNSTVEIRTMVDFSRTRLYNLVYVDNEFVLNFDKNIVIKARDIDDSFLLENLVELARPR